MASVLSPAKKRQTGKARRKAMFAVGWDLTKKNKIKRMARTLRRQPNNISLASRLDWWRKEGFTRKGTKYKK